MQISEYEQHLRRVDSRRKELRDIFAELFPHPTALSLEVGCGHGHWLVDYAAENGTKRCLGLDIIGGRIERANRKKERAGTATVDFVKAEAMEALDLMPNHVVLREIFILFPDPWPKKRHWKKRLLNPEFLRQLGDRCLTGTRCHFRTDHAGYFHWAEEVVAGQDVWKRDDSIPWPFERETIFQTRAESFSSLILVRQ